MVRKLIENNISTLTPTKWGVYFFVFPLKPNFYYKFMRVPTLQRS
jgi:hypothetical protein